MRNIKYLFIFTILTIGFSLGASSKSIGNFQIAGSYLFSGKLNIPDVTSPTQFRYAAQISRGSSGSGWEDGTCTVTAVLQNGSNYLSISDPVSFTNADFANGSIETSTALKINLLAIIPANTIDGQVKIKLEYYDSGTQSTVIVYSTNGYLLNVQANEPVIGTPPAFSAPVTGSLPVYSYTSSTGNILSKNYYSSYPGYTYSGVLGFLFDTQVTNTVPLYAFKNNSNVKDRYYGLANTKSGYTLQGVIGYVYLTPVSKTLPVNELYKNSGGGVYAFVSRTESRVDYTNNDVKFYMLQPKQNSINSLPDDDWAEFYCYYNPTSKDHYYTMERRDFGPWQYESVLAYISRIPRANMVPLYEYFIHTQTDHYYTLVKQQYGDYKYSGIAGYVYPDFGIAGTVPIHQFMNIYWDHLYTSQYMNLGPDNTYEGVKFHMKAYPY